ncbi:hypothetical protein NMG60_11022181 [Bertholletia excelsa]
MSGRRKNQRSATYDSRGAAKSKGKRKALTCDRSRLQDSLLRPDYILKKVFRKDGPFLGVEFDSLPSRAFPSCRKGRPSSKNPYDTCQETKRAPKGNKASRNFDNVCIEDQRAFKKRKVSKPSLLDYHVCNKNGSNVKQHGIGKGLMTAWRAINPDGGDFPTGVTSNEKEPMAVFGVSTSTSQKLVGQGKKSQKRQPVSRKLGKGTKVQDKRKPSTYRRKVVCHNTKKQKQRCKEKCKLALDSLTCGEDTEQFAMLFDDEELELQELQAGPNPVTCSAHFATSGLHGCSLCKDLLAKFPPNSVMTRLPFYGQPWGSSPELVKKLFKVFHFLYTYAVLFNICSFTIDEFAQAFNDKDSMLLGKIHLAFLRLLLSDVEMELSRGFFLHVSKNSKFLELLHSVGQQQHILEFWKKSLNSLTWTEILRQVFVAAGFGSKQGAQRKEALKEDSMAKFGLIRGSLKGELFNILSEQGNSGMKVSDLVMSSKIVDLKLAATADELELLISSTLSSDITLFEKISCSAYRIRAHSVANEAEISDNDPEDFGSVDDDSNESDSDSDDSAGDSDNDSGSSATRSKLRLEKLHKNENNVLTVDNEIDESNPGEAWLLGLMDGDYSDLSIEEKLNALVALVDLLSAGSSIIMEDSVVAECVPNVNYGSGAKIKRSMVRQHSLSTAVGGYNGQVLSTKELGRTSGLQPIDSLASFSKLALKAKFSCQREDVEETEDGDDVHPMQSIFLGSDRRYNRYWLFLGPCSAYDPGHKRIYIESSEDGHWEVIDTEEALCALLSALDCRGTREAHLLVSLRKREAFLCQAMSSMLNDAGSAQWTLSDHSELNVSREDSSSAVSDVDNNIWLSEIGKEFPALAGEMVLENRNREEQKKQKWNRLQAFDLWIWNSFYSDLNAVRYGRRSYIDSLTRCQFCHDLYWRDEKHCKNCHTTFELDFDLEERYTIHVATCKEIGKTEMFPKHKVLSSQLQVLKAAIYAIESVMPEGSLVSAWIRSAHKLWIKRLRRTSTLGEFLQVLADFVDAINGDWCQCNSGLGSNSSLEDIVASFATMPQTLSAIALWLIKLDALIAPQMGKVSY